MQIYNAIVANLVTDVYNLPATNRFIFVVFSISSIRFLCLLTLDDGQRKIQLTQKGHAKDDNNRLCWYFGNEHFDYEASWWNERENLGKILSDLEHCNIEAEIVQENMRRKNPDCLFWPELVNNETCFIHSKCKLFGEGIVFGNDIGAKSCPLEKMMVHYETTKRKIHEECINMPEYMKPFHCIGLMNISFEECQEKCDKNEFPATFPGGYKDCSCFIWEGSQQSSLGWCQLRDISNEVESYDEDSKENWKTTNSYEGVEQSAIRLSSGLDKSITTSNSSEITWKNHDIWVIATGWCVDAAGKEAGRNPNKWGLKVDDCFKLCLVDTNLNGCTSTDTGLCVTYTGDIKGGNGIGAYKCYYHTRMNLIFSIY